MFLLIMGLLCSSAACIDGSNGSRPYSHSVDSSSLSNANKSTQAKMITEWRNLVRAGYSGWAERSISEFLNKQTPDEVLLTYHECREQYKQLEAETLGVMGEDLDDLLDGGEKRDKAERDFLWEASNRFAGHIKAIDKSQASHVEDIARISALLATNAVKGLRSQSEDLTEQRSVASQRSSYGERPMPATPQVSPRD